MKLQYELSKLAIRDLNSIWNYTAEQWSISLANKYYKLIFYEIDLICQNPELGKSIQEVKKNHRIKMVKSHLIIYKVENEIIKVDRILHQRMDLDNQFEE